MPRILDDYRLLLPALLWLSGAGCPQPTPAQLTLAGRYDIAVEVCPDDGQLLREYPGRAKEELAMLRVLTAMPSPSPDIEVTHAVDVGSIMVADGRVLVTCIEGLEVTLVLPAR